MKNKIKNWATNLAYIATAGFGILIGASVGVISILWVIEGMQYLVP